MSEIPSAPVKRIFQKNGAERVSASALGIAVTATEEYIAGLAKAASASAAKEGRKTVMDADIDAARHTCGAPPVIGG
ncbi:MAG: NFYB/HAP3 family transcription factor subunit [Planctomycetes bacterium]|nr:NFYB/HAP3 family transcription factor subunit [Planctomycetota bacterium]